MGKQELIDQLVVAKKQINKTIGQLAKEVDVESPIVELGDLIEDGSHYQYRVGLEGLLNLKDGRFLDGYSFESTKEQVRKGTWKVIRGTN